MPGASAGAYRCQVQVARRSQFLAPTLKEAPTDATAGSVMGPPERATRHTCFPVARSTPYTAFGPVVTSGWHEVDVTDLYKGWKDGLWPNHGIELAPSRNNNTNGSVAVSLNRSGFTQRPANGLAQLSDRLRSAVERSRPGLSFANRSRAAR